MGDPERLIIDRSPGETRIAGLIDGSLSDFWVDRIGTPPRRVGEVVLARVTAVRPELSAAFVDTGHGEAFLKLGKKKSPAEGALLAVTVTTDAAGRKHAQVSRQISLDGRYLSLRPEEPGLAIAAAIKAKGKREALKTLLAPGLPEDIGLYVGQAALDAEDIQLLADFSKLLMEWKGVQDAIGAGDGPKVLQEAPNLETRLRAAFPDAEIIESSAGDGFEEADIDGQVEQALARRLPLANGTALTFDETEALVAIDVDIAQANTGPKGWARLFEEMTTEIARQIRLRRLSGLVLVDFPRLQDKAERAGVADAMTNALAGWPLLQAEAPPQVLGWSRGGVLEITVTRTGRSLHEEMMRPIEKHPRAATVALEALRRLVRETRGIAQPEMICAPDIAEWLDGPGRAARDETKEKLGGFLKLSPDPAYPLERIEIGPARR